MARSTSTTETDAKRRNDTIGLWIALGAGFGIVLGVIFGQIALGIALGAAFGVIIGSDLASRGDGRRADRDDADA
jgi:uncharacterized membrane protein